MSEPRPTTTVILLHESACQSIASDIGTFAMILGVVSVGYLLNDRMAEVLGFLMLTWSFGVRARAVAKRNRLSPQDAADRLARDFGVRAND